MPGITSSRSFLGRQLQSRLRVPHAAVWPRNSQTQRATTVGALPARPVFSSEAPEAPYFASGPAVSASSAPLWVATRSSAQSCVKALLDSFLSHPAIPSSAQMDTLHTAAFYAYNVLAHLGSGLSPTEPPKVLPPLGHTTFCPAPGLPSTWAYSTTVKGWNVLQSVFETAVCFSVTLSPPTELATKASALARCLYPLFAFAPTRLAL